MFPPMYLGGQDGINHVLFCFGDDSAVPRSAGDVLTAARSLSTVACKQWNTELDIAHEIAGLTILHTRACLYCIVSC